MIDVRPYRAGDRAAVRRICFLTGYLGEPADWYWRDEESFAEVFSGWYTDHEPGSAFVADAGGEVVGYLLGCRNSARAANPAALFGRQLVRRWLFARPGTAGYVWRSFADIARDAARRRLPGELHDPRWPAHLHVDLLPAARGTGVGARLMRTWLDMLRADGIAGCHLGTVAENAGAIAFFESMGFRRHGGTPPLPGLRTRDGARHHLQYLVQDL